MEGRWPGMGRWPVLGEQPARALPHVPAPKFYCAQSMVSDCPLGEGPKVVFYAPWPYKNFPVLDHFLGIDLFRRKFARSESGGYVRRGLTW